MKITHILMVCLGNICRSPMAEGILKHELSKRGIDVLVDSAGTSAWHAGELPDDRAIETCQKHGIDLTDQRSRPFTLEDFDRFDLIFAMDQDNYRNIISMARNKIDREKVQMIMNTVTPGSNQPVPDPYYGGDAGFQKVFRMLTQASVSIIDQYVK
jgi:protein-tyrosine phosphatase